MQFFELCLAVFIVGALAVGAAQYYGRAQDKAALTSDTQTVSAIALTYASAHCTVANPSLSLTAAQSALGTSAVVQDESKWNIAVTPRPVSGLNSGGASASIHYDTSPGTWESEYLLSAHHGKSTPTYVSIRVRRKPESPNRQSFRRLLEFGLC